MDKHINLLKQLLGYWWDKEPKMHDMLQTFDSISDESKQFLYKLKIYDLLKDE
jgi:hypothetical protein